MLTAGEKIRLLREQKGMSIEVLADLLDIPLECMWEIEKGERGLSKVTIQEVATLLGVPGSYFFEPRFAPAEFRKEDKGVSNESVGKRLRQFRTSKGITLSILSKKSGVSLAHLSEIERGRSAASLKTLEKLSAALGVSVSHFLRSEEEEPSLGNKLRRLREKVGLTQKELAQRIGISHGLVGQIETGRTQPSVATLNSLAEALGVSACYFLLEGEDGLEEIPKGLGPELQSLLQRPVLGAILIGLSRWNDKQLKSFLHWINSMESDQENGN
ncbi:MAG: helix-turn-helix domain-containing protein [Bacillota bacterium]